MRLVGTNNKKVVGSTPVKEQGLALQRVLVAQWVEHPTGVMEVVGSIPAWDSDLLGVPSSVAKHLVF